MYSDFAALDGRTVTEGHVKFCKLNGHAAYMADGVESGHCIRCGESREPGPRYTVIPHTQKDGKFWVYDTKAGTRIGEPVNEGHAHDLVMILTDSFGSDDKRMEERYTKYIEALKSYRSATKAKNVLVLLDGWVEIIVLALEAEDCRRRFDC